MMNEKQFKKINKPAACTEAPWANLIPYEERDEVLRQIRQETLDIYGQDYTECPKRKVCIGKSCIGRSLPWKSETAKPYLEKLKLTQNIINGELFITTDCNSCPIFKSCTSTCNQVNNFIERDKNKEPILVFKEPTENIFQEKLIELGEDFFPKNLIIPWDVINSQKQLLVKKYLYEQRDFKYVADSLGILNQAYCKYQFYAALTKLAEYGTVRKFLEENEAELTDKQKIVLKAVYSENKRFSEVAEGLGLSTASVSKIVNRTLKSYNVKWPIFVKKENNKLIYNIPEVLK